jgi:hypothetical protein
MLRWQEKATSKKQMGILEGSTRTSLVVLRESGALDTLAVSNLVLLERSLGQKVNPGRAGMLATLGAVAGFSMAFAISDAPPSDFEDLGRFFSGLGGAFIGGGIGLLIGLQPQTQWVPVDLAPVAGTTSAAPSP